MISEERMVRDEGKGKGVKWREVEGESGGGWQNERRRGENQRKEMR